MRRKDLYPIMEGADERLRQVALKSLDEKFTGAEKVG